MSQTLHEIIHDNADRIVDVFVRKTRNHELPPREADHSDVVDDLSRYVRELARAYFLGIDESVENSAKAHGGQRWYAGYDLKSVLLEYDLLRSVITEIVRNEGYPLTSVEAERLAQLINGGLAEAAVEFTVRATRQISEALVAAESAARAREDIVAVVSHDLKNPLNVIYGSVEMLKDVLNAKELEPERASLRSHLARIDRASVRMNHLISDLLDLAKIRDGRVELEVRLESTSDLLREAFEQSAPAAELRPSRLVNEGGVQGEVACDRERVLQVFDNLVGNAIKFSPPGTAVRLRVERSAEQCTFSVCDEGPGIPAEQLPMIFDRFWTAPRTSGVKGTGLGLAIARGIIDAHGGRIWVESTLGKGTCFFFTLPTHE